MKLIIDIPEEVKQAFDCAERNDLKGGYYDCGGVIGNAIRNGTPLPKGHGRLIDADAITKDFNTFQDSFVINLLDMGRGRLNIVCTAPTIIEADKEEK